MSEEHEWLQEGYSATSFPAYSLRCEREDCNDLRVVFNDADAKEWQDDHTKHHELQDKKQAEKQAQADHWAAQGGRPVKIQNHQSAGTYLHAPYAVKDAETTHVLVSGMKTVEEARDYAERQGWKIVGWPRGYKPEKGRA